MLNFDQTGRIHQHDYNHAGTKRRAAEAQRGFARRRGTRDIDLSSLTLRVRL